MLPLRDTIRSKTFPIVSLFIMLANGFVFFIELIMPVDLGEEFIMTFGLVPANLSPVNPLTWIPIFTHMFLHGGWFHFGSNMWTLFIFGDNVEDRLGSFRFLVFYLMGGAVAGIVQTMLSPGSTIPAIGASGAIAAVMCAYFFLFPKARVITLIPVFIFPWFVEIPAILYLGFWFVSQLFSGFLSLATLKGTQVGGVAWFAHIGGFLFGLISVSLFLVRKPRPRIYKDEYFPW